MPPKVPPSLLLLWPQLRGLLQLWVWGLLPEPPRAPQAPPLQTPEVWLLQPALGGLRVLWRGERSVLWRWLLLKWTLSQEELTCGRQVDKHFLLLLLFLLGLPLSLGVWAEPLSSGPEDTCALGSRNPKPLLQTNLSTSITLNVTALGIQKHRSHVLLQRLFLHKPKQ